MANGKQKGSGFEREVSKKLSKWWSKNERDDLFWRSQNSGGRWTTRTQKGLVTEGQAGDICSTCKESKLLIDNFVIECKSYKDINLWSMITGAKGTIVDWWDKVSGEAKQDGKYPVLIAKQNQKPVLIFANPFMQDMIELQGLISPIMIWNHDDPVFIYFFEEFLTLNPDLIQKRLEDA